MSSRPYTHRPRHCTSKPTTGDNSEVPMAWAWMAQKVAHCRLTKNGHLTSLSNGTL